MRRLILERKNGSPENNIRVKPMVIIFGAVQFYHCFHRQFILKSRCQRKKNYMLSKKTKRRRPQREIDKRKQKDTRRKERREKKRLKTRKGRRRKQDRPTRSAKFSCPYDRTRKAPTNNETVRIDFLPTHSHISILVVRIIITASPCQIERIPLLSGSDAS